MVAPSRRFCQSMSASALVDRSLNQPTEATPTADLYGVLYSAYRTALFVYRPPRAGDVAGVLSITPPGGACTASAPTSTACGRPRGEARHGVAVRRVVHNH